jgi:hypothetical protein
MGLFNPQPQTPIISSILPKIAQQEILNGRLPILNTNKLFLKKSEYCHYIDKAIYEKKIIQKRYIRNNMGYSMPGYFKGMRIHIGSGNTDVVENVKYETYKGILYITNQRIIFSGEENGFDKNISSLIAINSYSNCVELQFRKENIKIFIPDGTIVHAVLKQIK